MNSSPTLEISASKVKGVDILHLKGPVDANTQKDLEIRAGEIIADGANNIVLDFKEVSYLGSAGLRALHVIAGKFDSHGQADNFAHVKLLSPSDEVRRVLKTMGFDAYIGIYDDLDQAVSAF